MQEWREAQGNLIGVSPETILPTLLFLLLRWLPIFSCLCCISWNEGVGGRDFQEKYHYKYDFIIIRLAPYSLGSSKFLLFFPLHCGTPFQYSCLENPMDGGAWCAAVHGVAKSRTRLSDFTFTFHFHAFGEGNGNPLQCSCLENPRDGGAWWAAVMGLHRFGHDWSNLAAAAVFQLPKPL